MKNLIFSGIFLSCLAVSHAQISNPKEQIYKGTFSDTEGNTGVLEAILYTINPSNIQGIGIFKYQNHVVYGVLYLYPNPSADGSATLNGSFQPSEIQYDLIEDPATKPNDNPQNCMLHIFGSYTPKRIRGKAVTGNCIKGIMITFDASRLQNP